MHACVCVQVHMSVPVCIQLRMNMFVYVHSHTGVWKVLDNFEYCSSGIYFGFLK